MEIDPFNLNKIFTSYGLNVQCTSHRRIRNISLYDLYLSPGTRIRELQGFAQELALSLRAKSKPHFVPLPENGIVQMEVVEENSPIIPFWENFNQINLCSGALPTYLGSSLLGEDLCFDLAKNPHMLIAGGTGSGKSTLLHTVLANALNYSNTWIYIIDTKNVEFGDYKEFNQVQIANSYTKALEVLDCLDHEMEIRYEALRNKQLEFGPEKPYVILLIDEFADLIMQDKNKALYNLVLKLTQKCRAAGMFCVLATQRPSVDILKGPLKANFPARIACKVASRIDSRVILDTNGAELLAGNGDAIIKNYAYNYQRFQCAYTSPEETLKNARKINRVAA